MTEMIELKRDCEAIGIPSGIRQTLPGGTPVRIVQSRGGSYTVSTNFHAMFRIDAADADALGIEAATDPNTTPQGPLTEEMVWNTLKTVYDPEIPVNIVDLGLIYSCSIDGTRAGTKTIDVRMALTSPGCGVSNVLKADVETKLMRLPEVTVVRVEVVFDPPWTPDRMSEAARLQLGVDIGDNQAPGLTRISF